MGAGPPFARAISYRVGCSGGDFFLGPTATVTTRVGPFRLGLDGSVGAQLYKLNGDATVRPQGSLGFVVLFGMGR